MFNFFYGQRDKNMKTGLFILASAIIFSFGVRAQDTSDFYQDLLISDELKAEEAEQKAKNEEARRLEKARAAARSLLNKKTEKLNIDIPKIERRAQSEDTKALAEEVQNLDAAPFGLLWKASIAAIKNLGVILTPVEQKDYVNSFSATHLPKDPKGFRDIIITFGEEDELWRIIAVGNFLNDDASASKVLKEYRKYVRLLTQKYGNPQEFFTPKVTVVEKKVKEYGQEKIITEQHPEPIGNPEFLSQLQSGEAVLYSTFEGNNIGAALAINVDGDGKSYIIIDYKNIKILQERENEALDIL